MAINCVDPKPDPHDPRDGLYGMCWHMNIHTYLVPYLLGTLHFSNTLSTFTTPDLNLSLSLSLSLTLSSVDHHSPACTRAAASRVSSNSEKYHMLSGQGSNFRDIAIQTTLAP